MGGGDNTPSEANDISELYGAILLKIAGDEASIQKFSNPEGKNERSSISIQTRDFRIRLFRTFALKLRSPYDWECAYLTRDCAHFT